MIRANGLILFKILKLVLTRSAALQIAFGWNSSNHTLKTLKRNFGKPQLVTFLKLKLVLDLPQILSEILPEILCMFKIFSPTVKIANWLESIDNTSSQSQFKIYQRRLSDLQKI